MAGQRFLFGPFALDPLRRHLARGGDRVAIGYRALSILHALVEARGRALNKSELIALAWPGLVVEESNLSVQIAALRKALGPAEGGRDWIETVPRVGYRFAAPVEACDDEDESPPTPRADEFERRPSLAVLPFDNLSGDASQEYFADGITEDVIAALSRFRWFFVIGRNTSFVFKGKAISAKDVGRALAVQYVLAGSVRKSERRIRISVELVASASGAQLWAGHYDLEPGELFSVQDDIAQQVAGTIEPELLRSESALAAARSSDVDLTAWDLVHRGAWFFHQVARGTHLRARELFREACTARPGLAEAHAWLGRVDAGIVAYGWSDDEAADLAEGVAAALRAVHIDDKSPYAHYALAITSVFAGELGQAVRAAEMAIELSPGFALGHLVLGMATLYSGSAARAIPQLERGLRLNRYDPQNFVWHNLLALAYFFTGEHDRALQCALMSLKVRPKWRPAMETAICCSRALGRHGQAREWTEGLERSDALSGDALAPLKRANPHWRDELRGWLEDRRSANGQRRSDSSRNVPDSEAR